MKLQLLFPQIVDTQQVLHGVIQECDFPPTDASIQWTEHNIIQSQAIKLENGGFFELVDRNLKWRTKKWFMWKWWRKMADKSVILLGLF